jgi:hypothetical protein
MEYAWCRRVNGTIRGERCAWRETWRCDREPAGRIEGAGNGEVVRHFM